MKRLRRESKWKRKRKGGRRRSGGKRIDGKISKRKGKEEKKRD